MNIYENIRLVSYVSVADAFDKNKNIFHSFIPMVESMLLLSEDKLAISFLALQQRINEIYQINIPKDTLRYLLEILETQGKVRIKNGHSVIPTRNKIEVDYSLFEEHKNDIEDFFICFQQFLMEQNLDVALSEIRNQVCEWVYSHSSDLAEFIHKGRLTPEELDCEEQQEEWVYLSQFLSFLLYCRENNSPEYRAFIKLFDGAVQASLLNFTPREISEISDNRFEINHVLLDTNFILRLLNLQASIDNETAHETWDQLKKSGTVFYVLEQTVQEVSSSIRAFLLEIDPYYQHAKEFLQGSHIKASGFYDAFKNGMTRTDFFEYTKQDSIRKTLAESFAVIIVDDYCANPSPEDILSLIQSKDVESYREAQSIHDLILISYCRKMRPKRLQSIAKAQWWVLTNDKKLTFWNQVNCGEIQECITEVQLSNLLWIQVKKENNAGLSNTIVALASKFSISSNDVSRFAQQIIHYKERYANNIAKLDSLALTFASGALTNEDIKNCAFEEESFESTIENKAIAYQIEHIQIEEKLKTSYLNNEEKDREIKNLRQELDKTIQELDKTIELQTAEKDITDIQSDLAETRSLCKQIEKVLSNLESKKKPAGRMVLLSYLIPIVIFFSSAILFWAKPLLLLFLDKERIDFFLNLLSSGLATIVAAALYYVVIILVFGTPLNLKELFNELRDRRLLRIRKKYVRKNGFDPRLEKENLEVLRTMYNNQNSELEIKLSSLNERKDRILQDLAGLKAR